MSTGKSVRLRVSLPCRVSTRTEAPAASNARTTLAPIKPVAPVTRVVTLMTSSFVCARVSCPLTQEEEKLLQPALQMPPRHVGGPPPVRQLYQQPWLACQTADKAQRPHRAGSRCTGGHWESKSLVGRIKNRAQDGKGNTALDCS